MEIDKARSIKENFTSACLSFDDSRCSEQSYFLSSMSHVSTYYGLLGTGCRLLCCASQGTMIAQLSYVVNLS